MSAKNKVSLITTELNEREAITEFIDSALSQSLKPDEIVIADGGSTDGTIQIIKQRIRNGEPLRLVIAEGNRSVGRNAAIKAAKNNLIAVTDVGCRLDKDWLKNIVKPFTNSDTQVVSGFFQPDPQNNFELVSSILMTDEQKEIDVETWLPSSRSLAFTKKAWEKVGGYPEYEEFGNSYVARMCGGEDTLYDLKLRDARYDFGDGLKAVVYWRPRPNLSAFFKQYWMYSVGDGIRLVEMKHFVKLTLKYILLLAVVITLSFTWPWLILLIVVLALVKTGLRVRRKWSKVRKFNGLVLMMLLITTYDLAQITGFWRGYLARFKIPREKRTNYKPV